jgi:hypothetical protein
MSYLNTNYTTTHRPYSKAFLLIGDGLKLIVLVVTLALVGLLALIVISNIFSMQYLTANGVISTGLSLWLLMIVPELILVSILILLGLVAFYRYNRMAYSGYKIALLVVAVLSAGVFGGLLSLFVDSSPQAKSTFRNLETKIQSPLPSQSYMNWVDEECDKKGYYMGWVEDSNQESITINRLGERQVFPLSQNSQINVPSRGANVLVSSHCQEGQECYTEIVVVN